MSVTIRKKSPRAPSVGLEEAIERTLKIYKAERLNAAPIDVVAKDLGYTGAKNGTALSTIASLRYYGLVNRPAEGLLCVSKEFESFQYAPSDKLRHSIKTTWLTRPPVFAELLEKYQEHLPSDGVLKFDLIQKGFSPAAADACVNIFRRSVEFADYFNGPKQTPEPEELLTPSAETDLEEELQEASPLPDVVGTPRQASAPLASHAALAATTERILVRLSRGRRAWIEIPTQFYEADKDRLKAQIDLLLADDAEEGAD